MPGLLGAVRKSQARHSNTSDFYITLKKLPNFDGKSVIFGKVCLGFKELKRCIKIGPTIDITRTGHVELTHEHFVSATLSNSNSSSVNSTVFTLENVPDKRMEYLEVEY
jgi:cyclophilin family peptidyl-prolyl cis-trans isomerase